MENGNPFGVDVHYIGYYSVCTRERVWIRRAGRGGLRGWAWKERSRKLFFLFFPLKTQHVEMEKRLDSITQQEIRTWAVYLAWLIGWSVTKQEVNAAHWSQLQEVDLTRKQEALRSVLLDIWMDIICFCTFTRTVSFKLALLICSPLQNDSQCLLEVFCMVICLTCISFCHSQWSPLADSFGIRLIGIVIEILLCWFMCRLVVWMTHTHFILYTSTAWAEWER